MYSYLIGTYTTPGDLITREMVGSYEREPHYKIPAYTRIVMCVYCLSVSPDSSAVETAGGGTAETPAAQGPASHTHLLPPETTFTQTPAGTTLWSVQPSPPAEVAPEAADDELPTNTSTTGTERCLLSTETGPAERVRIAAVDGIFPTPSVSDALLHTTSVTPSPISPTSPPCPTPQTNSAQFSES